MKRGEGGSKETASATTSVMMCIRSWLGSIKYAVTLSSPALMPRTTYRSDPRPCKDAPMLGLESHVIFARHCQIWSHITVMWALTYDMSCLSSKQCTWQIASIFQWQNLIKQVKVLPVLHHAMEILTFCSIVICVSISSSLRGVSFNATWVSRWETSPAWLTGDSCHLNCKPASEEKTLSAPTFHGINTHNM